VIKLKIADLKDKETADAAAKALKKVEGVGGATVDREKGTAQVAADPAKDLCGALCEALKSLDLKSQVIAPVHLVFEAQGST